MVPEVIPLGMFTWSIESITNRNTRKGVSSKPQNQVGNNFNAKGSLSRSAYDIDQKGAERAFQKQKDYFSDPKKVPYLLQGDMVRMPTRRDDTKQGKLERLNGYAKRRGGKDDDPNHLSAVEKRRRLGVHTPAYHRQQMALQRQNLPPDDDETKILQYCISFTENCNVLEDDVEIY